MGRGTQRGAIIAVMFGLCSVFSYWAVDALDSPTLYEGDVLEERDCRHCGGDGVDEQMAYDYPQMGSGCHFCAGEGKVDVIIPGPNRPTRVWGAVVSGDTTGDYYDTHFRYSPPNELTRLPVQDLLTPAGSRQLRGPIGGATVRFERSDGEVIELEVNGTGRFSKRVPPGEWKVVASAPGHSPAECDTLQIDRLETPIWQERATLIEPPESREHAQALYGISMLIILRADDEGDLRVYPPFF